MALMELGFYRKLRVMGLFWWMLMYLVSLSACTYGLNNKRGVVANLLHFKFFSHLNHGTIIIILVQFGAGLDPNLAHPKLWST